jgi:ATP synthase protein I
LSEPNLEQTIPDPEAPSIDDIDEAEQEPKTDPMAEFYQLEKTLTIVTLVVAAIVFFPVWLIFSLNTAFNCLLGAIVGVVYLRLLSKDVERLGQQESRLGVKGLGLFCGLIIIASRWQQLHILPVFFGFLTYKVAIFLYMLKVIPLKAKE